MRALRPTVFLCLLSAAAAGQDGALPEGAILRLRDDEGHSDGVTGAAFHPAGDRVLSASRDGTLTLWELPTARRVRTFRGHAAGVRSLALSPDGRLALSASEDKTLALWDAASGERLRVLQGHTGAVQSVAFSSDGRRAVSGGVDHTAIVWDLASGKPIRELAGHKDILWGVAYSPLDTHVLTASQDGSLGCWEVESGKQVHSLRGLTGGWSHVVESVAFTLDGRRALCGYWGDAIGSWDLEKGLRVGTYLEHSGPVISLAVGPDGLTAASGSRDKTAVLWDVREERSLRRFSGHTGAVRSVAFSPGGRLLATASEDGSVLLWHPDLELAREAVGWARSWKSGEDERRAKDLETTLTALASRNRQEYAAARERLLALGKEALGPLLRKYPPDPGGQAPTEDRLQVLLRALDHDDFDVRANARKELRAHGRRILPWVELRLKDPSKSSAEVRNALEETVRHAKAASRDMSDLGHLRAVLLLLETNRDAPVIEALERYARGRDRTYAAVLIRRALGKD